MSKQDFVGTWRLISWEAHSSDGKVTYPFGEDADGFIMYALDEHMSVVIFRAEREPFGTSDVLAGSEKQLAAAARSYISYAGRFEVQGERVRHFVEASLFPDWVGSTQARLYEFEGDRLMLSTDLMPLGGEQMRAVLTWERVLRHA